MVSTALSRSAGQPTRILKCCRRPPRHKNRASRIVLSPLLHAAVTPGHSLVRRVQVPDAPNAPPKFLHTLGTRIRKARATDIRTSPSINNQKATRTAHDLITY